MISKEALLKFQNKLGNKTSDNIKLEQSGVDYLAGVAPKPKISKKIAIKIPKKKLMNIPKFKEKQLKEIPKFEKIVLPTPQPVVAKTFLKTVEIPKVEFHEIDPWPRVVELLDKCNIAVKKKNLDFAEFYYGQVQPFYNQLNETDKRFVFFKIQELQESIIELRMDRVKQIIEATF